MGLAGECCLQGSVFLLWIPWRNVYIVCFCQKLLSHGLPGDALHSRAALYTALTRLYSASGGSGRLRLQWVQQAHQSQIYHSTFWGALKLPLRSKKRAVFFLQILNFADQNELTRLCATLQAVCFQHGSVQIRRAVPLAIMSRNPYFTNIAHSHDMSHCWLRPILPYGVTWDQCTFCCYSEKNNYLLYNMPCEYSTWLASSCVVLHKRIVQ